MKNFSEPWNYQKLNIKKISAHRFEDLIFTNKLEGFLFLFFIDLESILRLENHLFGRHFLYKKINFKVIWFQRSIKFIAQNFIKKTEGA